MNKNKSDIRSIPFFQIGNLIFSAGFRMSWTGPSLFLLLALFVSIDDGSLSSESFAFAPIIFFVSWIIGLFVSQMYSFLVLPVITFRFLPFVESPNFYRLYAGAVFPFCLLLIFISMSLLWTNESIVSALLVSAWVQAISVLGLYCWKLNQIIPLPLSHDKARTPD